MRVPTYERQVQQNTPNVIDPGQQAFGVGVAQAQQQAAREARDLSLLITQRALELQEREDARQVQEAETNYRRALDNLIYSPEDGLANRKLSDAAGVTIDFDEQANKLREEYLKALPGENQKLQFSLSSDAFNQSARGYMLRYETDEIRKGEENTVNEYLKVNGDDVVRDPLNLAESMQRAEEALGRFIDISRPELSEQREALIDKEKGRLAAVAINEYLNAGNSAAARELYKEHKDLLIEYSQKTFYELDGVIRKAETQAVDIALKNGLSSAGNLDKNFDFDALMQNNKTVIEGLKELGWQDEAIQLQITTHTSQMVTSRINSLLTLNKEAGIEEARTVFEKYKDSIDGDTAAKIQSALDNAGFNIKLDTKWEGGLQAYKLDDGYTFDLNAIYAELEKDYSGSDLDKAKNYIKGLVSEAEAISGRERNVNQTVFQNGIAEVFNGKGTKAQALTVLNNMRGSFSEHEYMINKRYIDDLFAVPELKQVTNDNVYVGLFNAITDGTARPSELRKTVDAAFNDGYLSRADWEKLRGKIDSEKTGGQQYEDKQKNDYINRKAGDYYQKDSLKRDQFKYYWQQRSEGMTLDALMDAMNKGMEGKTPSWEIDYQTANEADKVWSTFYDFFSSAEVDAIKRGIGAYYNTASITSSEMIKFLSESGGTSIINDKVKFDNAFINAAKTLVKYGKEVSPANIAALLEQWPQGVPPGESATVYGRWLSK